MVVVLKTIRLRHALPVTQPAQLQHRLANAVAVCEARGVGGQRGPDLEGHLAVLEDAFFVHALDTYHVGYDLELILCLGIQNKIWQMLWTTSNPLGPLDLIF